ncbi:MAG: FecCD family ABC transporter permease [Dehalococcoidia bacterium]
MLFSLQVGAVAIPTSDIFKAVLKGIPFLYDDFVISDNWSQIIFDIRLPRVLAAGIVGAGLSLAGLTYQGVFRNNLADPYLLGIASGSALAVTIANFFLPLGSLFAFFWIQICAFVGGLIIIGFVYIIGFDANSRNFSKIILTGIALSSLCTALTFFLLMLESEKGLSILSFLFGSFNLVEWRLLMVAGPIILFGIFLLNLFGHSLNILQIGLEESQTLGINSKKMSVILILIASIITCSAVALAGIIGFVGLVIPHLCRLLFGNDYKNLLITSAFIGAIFLILIDDAVRTIIAPREIPIGAMTALIGSPLFVYFLVTKRRGYDL